jgi:Zn-dependent metallo-hydrolase RNA specificity domain
MIGEVTVADPSRALVLRFLGGTGTVTGSRFLLETGQRAGPSFSAHADRDEFLAWLRTPANPPARVYLVHGEPDASAALAESISEQLGRRSWLPAVSRFFSTVRAAVTRAPCSA